LKKKAFSTPLCNRKEQKHVELYAGPMNSMKTAKLIDRVDQLMYIKEKNKRNETINRQEFLFIKPDSDTRDDYIKSRSRGVIIPCERISATNPYFILDHIKKIEEKTKKDYKLIAIDEVQFFSKGIEQVIEILQKENRNIILGGLDLDFRGEPFGMMGNLALIANEVYKLVAVCEVCESPATRTQRLINGEPANYHEPIVSIEGKNLNETYEARCLKHHYVPGRP
jgi:thymidine kinase